MNLVLYCEGVTMLKNHGFAPCVALVGLLNMYSHTRYVGYCPIADLLISQRTNGTFRNTENQDYTFVSPSLAVPCYNDRPYDELFPVPLNFEPSIHSHQDLVYSLWAPLSGGRMLGKMC